MDKCFKCKMPLRPNADFCTYCGVTTHPSSKENVCTNPSCERHLNKYQFGSHEQHCDKCGALTSLGLEIAELL